MKLKKKLLIAFSFCVLLVIASIGAALLYYFSHPDAVKPFIEKTLSKSTGMAWSIHTLTYSLDPLTAGAEGIILIPPKDQPGPRLEISNLAADMALEGRFGHKTLTLKRFRIQEFLLDVPGNFVLPEGKTGQRTSSFLSQILGWAVRQFLFSGISFTEAEILDGKITSEFGEQTMQIKGIRANLNPDHSIRISCDMVLEWPAQDLRFTAPNVLIITEDTISLLDTEITGLLETNSASFHSPEINVEHIESKATIHYSVKNKTVNFEPIELQLDGTQFKQAPDMSWPPIHTKLRIQGCLNIQDRKLRIAALDLNANDTFQLKGKADIGLGAQTDFRFNILDGYLLTDQLQAIVPDHIMEGIPINVSGPIRFSGDMSGWKDPIKWTLHCDLQAILDGNGMTYAKGQTQIDARVSGNIRASGDLPKLILSVDLKSEQIRMGLGDRDLQIEQVRIEIVKGVMNTEVNSLYLPDIRFDSSLLRSIHGSVDFAHGLTAVKLRGEDVDLIESAHILGLLPSGWQCAGRSDLDISVIQNKDKKWIIASQVACRQLAFESMDGGYLGEGISFILNTDGKLDLTVSQLTFNTTLATEEGELLLDRLYFDLGSNDLASSLEGTYDISQQTLELSSQQVLLKDILSFTSNGTIHFKAEEPRIHLLVNIPKTSLKPIFRHFVLEPFQTEKPFLASLDLAGDISADLHVNGSISNWTVKGHGMWHEGRFTSEDNRLSLSGVDLDLPLWLQSNTPTLPHSFAPRASDVPEFQAPQDTIALAKEDVFDSMGREDAMRGTLLIQKTNIPMLTEQSLKLSLTAEPNRLSVKEPTSLKIPGGVCELGPILFENIVSSKRSVKTRLRFEEIDAAPLLSQYLPISVHGTINGELETIYFQENEINSSGQIRAQLFGGEILLSDIGSSGFFSSFPLYRVNINAKKLNLSELTKGTSFGEIQGILQGHIHGLEMANGQPQKFDLMLETVDTKGIDQKISIRAVDNIARIGGGASPFMGLTGAFVSLFQKLPYSKIGIRASLLNDTFRINGIEREGTVDYLVKRGSFSGVNIVNQNPNTSISFRDMVKRIERVVASESGPEVK